MARRAGKRGGSRMRMSKVTKRRAYCRRRKPAKRQYRKRKRDEDSEVRVRDYKGKKIKQNNSDVDTDAGTSLATSLQEFSDETSAGPASCPSDSTPGKKVTKHDEKGKNKRKSRKEVKEIREVSGDSKTTTEKTSTRKSAKKHSSKRRRSSQKGEEQTQMTKGSESGKPSESAGSANMKKNHNVHDGNDPQKGEPKDAMVEPGCNDKAAPKDVVVEEHHEDETSSSSG